MLYHEKLSCRLQDGWQYFQPFSVRHQQQPPNVTHTHTYIYLCFQTLPNISSGQNNLQQRITVQIPVCLRIFFQEHLFDTLTCPKVNLPYSSPSTNLHIVLSILLSKYDRKHSNLNFFLSCFLQPSKLCKLCNLSIFFFLPFILQVFPLKLSEPALIYSTVLWQHPSQWQTPSNDSKTKIQAS